VGPEALRRLLDSREQFLAFLRKRVDDPATAEDLLQSAFVRGLERGDFLRDDESAVAWFYRVLRNAVIDHYRYQAAAGSLFESWPENLDAPAPSADATKGEVCGCLYGLLETLKPEYRAALQTVDLGDGSLKDLAAQAGITPGNAAVRVHRAREALKRQVQAACGACAEHGCLDCTCRSG
jgi:RNA polymerase sigma-70 factor (ECF subfamily)